MLLDDQWLTVTKVFAWTVYISLPVTVLTYLALRLWRDSKAQWLGIAAIATAAVTSFLVGIYDPGIGYTVPWYFDHLFKGGSASDSLRVGNDLGEDGVSQLGVTVTVAAWASAALFLAVIALVASTVARWRNVLRGGERVPA